jgi:hypothetical protein
MIFLCPRPAHSWPDFFNLPFTPIEEYLFSFFECYFTLINIPINMFFKSSPKELAMIIPVRFVPIGPRLNI